MTLSGKKQADGFVLALVYCLRHARVCVCVFVCVCVRVCCRSCGNIVQFADSLQRIWIRLPGAVLLVCLMETAASAHAHVWWSKSAPELITGVCDIWLVRR